MKTVQYFENEDLELPVYYQLDIADEGRTLLFKIPEEVWSAVQALAQHTQWIGNTRRNHDAPEFIRPMGLPWGFGPFIMASEDQNPGWQTLRIELPDFPRSQAESIWPQAHGLLATLNFLFWMPNYLMGKHGVELSTFPEQVVKVEMGKGSERHSFYINAELSQKVLDWADRQPQDQNHEQIGEWMWNAHQRMFGADKFDTYRKDETSIRIYSHGHIVFSCPGDRCSLYMIDHDRKSMGDHNVDNPQQICIFLIGLAGMHRLVLEEM